jgi:hypothetical protein
MIHERAFLNLCNLISDDNRINLNFAVNSECFNDLLLMSSYYIYRRLEEEMSE